MADEFYRIVQRITLLGHRVVERFRFPFTLRKAAAA